MVNASTGRLTPEINTVLNWFEELTERVPVTPRQLLRGLSHM